MHVPLWVWIVSVVVVVAIFVFDFVSHVRKPHEPSAKEATFWTLFYMGLSMLFMVGIGLVWNWTHAAEYLGGYATELALSIDNLFVFIIIMTSFKVPREAQQKALLLGIAIALVLRGGFIIAGSAVLEHFSWVFYIFGAWLAFIAIRQAIESFKNDEPEMPGWVGLVKKVIHTSERYDHDRWTIMEGGRRALTPLVLVVVALGITDLLFALDSIPAIFAITQEGYIVFAANAFALMGLRQLYFLIGKLMKRLVFLDLGLAFILGFIALKLVFHALHVNELPFINGGQGVEWAPEIPIWFSLAYIFGVLLVSTVASLLYSGRIRSGELEEEAGADSAAADGAELADGGELADGAASLDGREDAAAGATAADALAARDAAAERPR